ncbi:hypothetical protein ACYZTL_03660 [Pseudomonas sp. LB3P81]
MTDKIAPIEIALHAPLQHVLDNNPEFLTEREFWKSGITDEKDRLNWIDLLPAGINSFHAMRLKSEEKTRAVGIEIDESYQDPPIHALGQVNQ